MKQFDKFWSLPFHWLLPALFFATGLIYLYGSPHFEAPDNISHVGVIKWIAENNGALPVQFADHDHLYAQEGSQPPLYYLLMAPIFAILDTSDFDEFYQPNPRAFIGFPKQLGNRNLVFYQQPYPPNLNGSSLALYVIRLVTLVIATVTVAAVYQSARTVMPGHIGFAVMATTLAAFNPQFLFISSSVSNDNLVSMLTAVACWQALLLLRDGFETRRSILLAIIIAFATLSKLGGLVMAPVVSLAGLWLYIRTRDRRGFFILVGSIIGACLLISGWWFARNLSLYGELFGTSAMLDNFGRRSMTLPTLLLDEFEGLRISYWGLFGAFSILTHDIYYRIMDLLSLLGAAGLLVFLVKNRKNVCLLAVVSFLAILLAIGSAMLIWWTLQTSASTGRLLFPYITSISLLMAMGLLALRIPPLLIALPMLAFSIAAPFLYIIPNYDHPPQMDQLPPSATATFARWEDITLVGYEVPASQRWSAGDEIPLTLYWRPQSISTVPLAFFISLIDAEGKSLATIDTFPGWGSLPTTWWQPNKIYRDDYILQIPADASGFSTVQLHIGWYSFHDSANIKPVSESGEPLGAFTIPVGAFVGDEYRQTLETDAMVNGTIFGEAVQLNKYRFTEGHVLELEWEILREISGDLRIFAIVLAEPYQINEAFEILHQQDTLPPVPLTYLETGETFISRHEFDLPAGYQAEHSIYVGWYNEDIGERLTIPYPANMLSLKEIRFHG